MTYRQRVAFVRKFLRGTTPKDVVTSKLPEWATPYDLKSGDFPKVVIHVEGATDVLKWPDECEIFWEDGKWAVCGRGF